MDKVYVVSYSIALARRWAIEKNIETKRLVIMTTWEHMMGQDGFNKVLHILPGAFRIKAYTTMMEYSKTQGWTNSHEYAGV